MKRCPLCDKTWEDDKHYCPWDGHLLKDRSLAGANAPTDPLILEPQFELLEQMQQGLMLPGGQALEAPSNAPPNLEITESQRLVDVAIKALKTRQERDREAILDNMKYFEQFNKRCRVITLFIDSLQAESDNFKFKVEHMDEEHAMWMRFTLCFGEGRYYRTFPITVTYQRVPQRDVFLRIDLYDIGRNEDQRYFRTERAGGKVEDLIMGRAFLMTAPRGMEAADLLKWLERSFKAIFKLAYTEE